MSIISAAGGFAGSVSSSPYPWSLTMEDGITGWSADANVSIAQSTTQAHGGSNSLRVINTASAAYNGTEIALPAAITVNAGINLVVDVWIYGATGAVNSGVSLLDSSNQGYGTIATLTTTTQYVAEYASKTTYVGYSSGAFGLAVGAAWIRHRLSIVGTTITATYYSTVGGEYGSVSRTLSNNRTLAKLFIRHDQNAYIYVDDITLTVTGA